MAISIFDPRVMDQMVRVLPATGGFFRDTFFTRRVPIVGTKVDVDFYKGKRRIAPFVNPRGSGKTVERTGYSTNTFETPLLKPKDVLTVEDLNVRLPGENILWRCQQGQTRAIQITTDKLDEFNDSINRPRRMDVCPGAHFWQDPRNRRRRQLRDRLQLQQHRYSNWYGMLGQHRVRSSRRHRRMGARVQTERIQNAEHLRDGKGTPYAEFIGDSKGPVGFSDAKNINLAVIEPKMISENVTYVGTIPQWNMSFYLYDEWYLDDWTDPTSPVEKPLVPSGTVLLAVHQYACGYLLRRSSS